MNNKTNQNQKNNEWKKLMTKLTIQGYTSKVYDANVKDFWENLYK